MYLHNIAFHCNGDDFHSSYLSDKNVEDLSIEKQFVVLAHVTKPLMIYTHIIHRVPV